jgi:hypothetical protein
MQTFFARTHHIQTKFANNLIPRRATNLETVQPMGKYPRSMERIFVWVGANQVPFTAIAPLPKHPKMTLGVDRTSGDRTLTLLYLGSGALDRGNG